MKTANTSLRLPSQRGVAVSRKGQWLFAMRVGWLLIVLVDVALFVASLSARWDQLASPNDALRANLAGANLSVRFYAGYNIALEVMPALVFLVVGLLIFWRKSDEPIGIFISLMLAMFGMAARPIMPTMDALISANPEFTPLVRLMTYITWVSVFAFFCVFPDGRFFPRWTRVYLVVAAVISIPWNLFPDSALSPWTWPPALLVPFEFAIWGTAVYARIARYRHYADWRQKQQTRWVVFGLLLSVMGIVAFFIPRYIDPSLNDPANSAALPYQLVSPAMIYLAALCTPIALAISILRYRLWDIDVILSRTLVYVPLTAILAGSYTASVLLFQRLSVAATGQQSDAAVVVTTLIMASLFTPIKNTLQTRVDKHFKESHDPVSELTAFTEQVQSVLDVIDTRELTRNLLDEAIRALDATGGAIYLGAHGHMRLMNSTDDWDGDVQISIPLCPNGERTGLLVLGPRRNGKDYCDEDQKILRDVVDSVALAVSLSPQA